MNKTFAVSTTRWFLDRSQDDSSTFDSVTPPGLAKPMAEPKVADVEKSGILGILGILQVFLGIFRYFREILNFIKVFLCFGMFSLKNLNKIEDFTKIPENTLKYLQNT